MTWLLRGCQCFFRSYVIFWFRFSFLTKPTNGFGLRKKMVCSLLRLLSHYSIRTGTRVSISCWNGAVGFQTSVIFISGEPVMEKIPTKLALRKRNMLIEEPSCPFCCSADESAEHILTACSVSSAVWNDISLWCKIPSIYAFSIKDLLGIHSSLPASAKKKEAIYGIVIIVCWSLWRARNKLVFSNIPVRIDRILSEVKALSFLWYSNRSKYKGVSWEEWVSFVNM
ncbi:putative reverse transcriptase zinc-binding domain-containing protein [Helianthus annuus]|nr:putative reverse transcriptase zinc-binding domain-containing protein [Helianthus annuus]KAJ0784723.1 putative reverse transcriptase zinc-binding domain-containing protein [Helianthus annuus]KAJ0949818.1 putative reverse transcriptase zinc-binding domain-containing protein [Helianthus annuus]